MTNFFFYWYIYLVGLYNLNIKNHKGVVGMKDLHFNIHYLDESVPPLEVFNGSWVDVRAIEVKITRTNGEVEVYKSNEFETVTYEKGDILFVNLGFSMDMTDLETGEQYVGHIYPRSSLFKNYKLFLTNHVACIDSNYNGTNNYWMAMFLAMDKGEVHKLDRLCQIEICKPQPKLVLHEVEDLGNKDRGKYGSTGRN